MLLKLRSGHSNPSMISSGVSCTAHHASGQHFLEVTRPAIFPLVQDKAFQVDVIFFPTSLRQRLDLLRPILVNLVCLTSFRIWGAAEKGPYVTRTRNGFPGVPES